MTMILPAVRGKHDRVYSDLENKMKGRVRARHETVNGKLKNWNILSSRFRVKGKQMLDKHRRAFNAVAVITQLELCHRTPLFKANYSVKWNWAAR
jgi:hypothetical protein